MATCDDLPLGYKFEPEKEELVGYFLKRRLRGQPLESFYNDLIMDYDVYCDHPSNIMAKTNRKVEEDGIQQGYFFSSLKKTSKSKNGKRINRCIPTHGTWSEKAATTTVCNKDKEVLGIHKYYKFNPVSESKGSMLNNDEWMMHEYSLSDKQQDLVLCHITNKKKYNNKNNTTKAGKVNMVVDQPLDYEAGPSKISRVDQSTYTACIDDLLSLITHNNKAGNECADDGGGVQALFENGYKHAMEQIIAQEDHHNAGLVIGEMPPIQAAASEFILTTSSFDPTTQDYSHVNGIPTGEMAQIQAAANDLTLTATTFDPPTQEDLSRLQAFLMA